MQKGFNSDLVVRGKKYHVQTEDWGDTNPFVVSRVFLNGAVIKTVKTPYSEILQNGPQKEITAIARALQQQHTLIVDALMSANEY